MTESNIEEVLEYLWYTRERGENSLSALREYMATDNQPVPEFELLETMETRGFLLLENSHFKLTEKGDRAAEQIIRRHRLAERLFSDVLNATTEEMETIACELEHILSPEVTDSVCTFLGHPPLCPHGRPIPPGECCKRQDSEVQPLVISVRQLHKHTPAKIMFTTPKIQKRFQRLASLGVTPGTEIMVKQRHPSIVVQVGETEIAIDDEIASEIYVRNSGQAIRSEGGFRRGKRRKWHHG